MAWKRATKTKDLRGKLVFALRTREKVWAVCALGEAAALVEEFQRSESAGGTWFSLMPHAPTTVRVEAVEALYYLGAVKEATP